jgi:hypothetical protein
MSATDEIRDQNQEKPEARRIDQACGSNRQLKPSNPKAGRFTGTAKLTLKSAPIIAQNFGRIPTLATGASQTP